jgi:uncharacterized membrane protein
MENQHIEYTRVFTTANEAEAQLIAGRLNTQGIQAQIYPPAPATPDEYNVLVKSEDYTNAVAVLDVEAPEVLPEENLFGDGEA